MMPKTRTNLLGRKVKVEYSGGGDIKTKTITKKDGSETIRTKRVYKNLGPSGNKGYLKKTVDKTVPTVTRSGGVGKKYVFEKSKSKDIRGLNRLFGKRRKTKYDAKTGVDTYKTKKTAFSKPIKEKY